MELFCVSTPESRAIELICHYSTLIKCGKCRITVISKAMAESLGLTQAPRLLADGTNHDGLLAIVPALLDSVNDANIRDALCGNTSYKRAKIDEWIVFAVEASFNISNSKRLSFLNSSLEPSSFLLGHHITVADLIVYPSIYEWMSKADEKTRTSYCNITRWFDHIQNMPGIKGVIAAMDVLSVVPKSATTELEIAKIAASGHKTKKQAKEPKKKNPQVNAKSPDAERPVDDFSRLDIRVGVITKVWPHADADSLYCEEIDIGENEPRKIASGLRNFIPIDKMEKQKVIVLANLKVRNLRGYPSHGMVLCVTDSEKQNVELLRPPARAKVGERVILEGFTVGDYPDADAVLSQKEGKDPFKAASPYWSTNEEKLALHKDKKWLTTDGPCFCDTISGGTIS